MLALSWLRRVDRRAEKEIAEWQKAHRNHFVVILRFLCDGKHFLPSSNLNRRRQFFILFCGVSALCTIWKSLWSSTLAPLLRLFSLIWRRFKAYERIRLPCWFYAVRAFGFFESLILILYSVKSNGTCFPSYLILTWLKWFVHDKFLQVQYNLLYFFCMNFLCVISKSNSPSQTFRAKVVEMQSA